MTNEVDVMDATKTTLEQFVELLLEIVPVQQVTPGYFRVYVIERILEGMEQRGLSITEIPA